MRAVGSAVAVLSIPVGSEVGEAGRREPNPEAVSGPGNHRTGPAPIGPGVCPATRLQRRPPICWITQSPVVRWAWPARSSDPRPIRSHADTGCLSPAWHRPLQTRERGPGRFGHACSSALGRQASTRGDRHGLGSACGAVTSPAPGTGFGSWSGCCVIRAGRLGWVGFVCDSGDWPWLGGARHAAWYTGPAPKRAEGRGASIRPEIHPNPEQLPRSHRHAGCLWVGLAPGDRVGDAAPHP